MTVSTALSYAGDEIPMFDLNQTPVPFNPTVRRTHPWVAMLKITAKLLFATKPGLFFLIFTTIVIVSISFGL